MNFIWAGARRCLQAPSRAALFVRCISTARDIPEPRGGITNPSEFLRSIGRDMSSKLQVEDWESFWRKTGKDMKKDGLGIRDRRYTLLCMQRFAQGHPVESFAHEPPPKKKLRGWGPSIQNGKRLRTKIQKFRLKAKARTQGRL